MPVRWNLRHGQCHTLCATGLGACEAVAEVQRDATTQVRQTECGLAVAAIGRADQVEERLVLRDGKELALAEHPAGRCEVAGEHSDFTDVRLCHCYSPPFRSATGRCPEGRCRSSGQGTAACWCGAGCRQCCRSRSPSWP